MTCLASGLPFGEGVDIVGLPVPQTLLLKLNAHGLCVAPANRQLEGLAVALYCPFGGSALLHREFPAHVWLAVTFRYTLDRVTELYIPLALILTMLVIGIVLLYLSPDARLKRAIRDAKKYSINGFPDRNHAKIVGSLVLMTEQLEAPISGRPCAYYSVEVFERRKDSDGDEVWRSVFTVQEGVDFMLDDGTGEAIVGVESAKVILSNDHESDSGTFDDEATERQQRFLIEHEHKAGQFLIRGLRYTEAILEPGEFVAVVGYGTRKLDSKALASVGYRDQPPMQLHLQGSARYPLMISDQHKLVRS